MTRHIAVAILIVCGLAGESTAEKTGPFFWGRGLVGPHFVGSLARPAQEPDTRSSSVGGAGFFEYGVAYSGKVGGWVETALGLGGGQGPTFFADFTLGAGVSVAIKPIILAGIIGLGGDHMKHLLVDETEGWSYVGGRAYMRLSKRAVFDLRATRANDRANRFEATLAIRGGGGNDVKDGYLDISVRAVDWDNDGYMIGLYIGGSARGMPWSE